MLFIFIKNRGAKARGIYQRNTGMCPDGHRVTKLIMPPPFRVSHMDVQPALCLCSQGSPQQECFCPFLGPLLQVPHMPPFSGKRSLTVFLPLRSLTPELYGTEYASQS